VRRCAPSLARAIDAIAARLERGGRLVYAGAGSSGRLALVDAAECGPTFGVAPEQIVALVAGCAEALAVAQEAAGDAAAAAADAGAALARADGNAKIAIVSLLAGVDADAARARLEEAGGVVRRALAPMETAR